MSADMVPSCMVISLSRRLSCGSRSFRNVCCIQTGKRAISGPALVLVTSMVFVSKKNYKLHVLRSKQQD